MNFEDESYVRLYIRDTNTWLRLGFEGQAVLMFLLRKLDRAGVLDGIEDLFPDVALFAGVPLELVKLGLPRLLDRGVLVSDGGRLVMPNYVHAQNCSKSDRARQLESRAKRASVTNRDQPSQNVTERHDSLENVTKCHSYLSVAKPSQTQDAPLSAGAARPSLFADSSKTEAPRAEPANQNDDCLRPQTRGEPGAASDGSTVVAVPSEHPGASTEHRVKKAKVKVEADPEVLQVFEHWRKSHPRALLDVPRAKAVRRQLDAGRTVDYLCKAVDGYHASAWHTENAQTDLELICRDAKHVERFMPDASGRRASGGDGLVLA